MALEALTNSRWGFETNCFVCEPSNTHGLQIPFFHDTDRDIVVAEFTLGNHLSGAPTWIHGGVSLAILDEAMAWATIAVRHRWAVTKSSTAEFPRPVVVDRPYRLVARIERASDDTIETSAEILRADADKVCVRATAIMTVVTEVQAPALGLDTGDGNASYLREA